MIRALLLFFSMIFLIPEGQAQAQRKLVWADEFNKPGLPDTSTWSYEKGYIRNKESQYYTVGQRDNAQIKDGFLFITALYDSNSENKITSASLITKNKKQVHYGRVEVRAKLPVGRGTWPAIWLLGTGYQTKVGWPECGELDIMENVGFDSLRVHANIHTKAYNHVKNTNKGNSMLVDTPFDEFHVYAMEWSKNKIDFFIDDQKYFTYEKEKNATQAEWPFDNPHYLILNLAIGGAWGGQKGIDMTKFPHEFVVDYVRVYK